MDRQESVFTEDFLQAALDDVQGRKEECEPLFARIQKMRKQTKSNDDSIVQSIKDGRITPEMASRWIKTGL